MPESSSSPKAWTVLELLKWATEDFKKRGIESPRLDAELLLSHALNCSRVELYLRFEDKPGPEELARFRELVRRRRTREPVAHILGRREFHGIELLAPPGLFVPRPETELLVDEALSRLQQLSKPSPLLLDLGTGTGAIALSVLKACKKARAVGVDIDPLAVKTAAENAARLGLAERFQVVQGDAFAALQPEEQFDLILCNPPYVPSGEISSLMPEVKNHEPRAALDGGEGGLDFIRMTMKRAPDFLAFGGWLILEVGEGQASAVKNLAQPPLKHEATRLDLQQIPRVVIFLKEEG